MTTMRLLYSIRDRLPAPREPGRCGHRHRAEMGYTLAEVMIAVVVLGLTLVGVMEGLSFMEMRNRESSQRMLAASIETEILELFKAQPYTEIANSTVAAPVYLKEVPGGAPDARWIVPAVSAWQPVPVEDVDPSSDAAPASVPDKLPNGVWKADFVTDPATPSVVQVTVTMRWQLYRGNTQRTASLSTSTIICQNFPNL